MGRQATVRPRKGKPAAAKTRVTRKVISDFPIALFRETDEAASELHLSRSAIIRRAVEELLKRRRREKLQAQVDAYFDQHADFERSLMEDFKHVDTDAR